MRTGHEPCLWCLSNEICTSKHPPGPPPYDLCVVKTVTLPGLEKSAYINQAAITFHPKMYLTKQISSISMYFGEHRVSLCGLIGISWCISRSPGAPICLHDNYDEDQVA